MIKFPGCDGYTTFIRSAVLKNPGHRVVYKELGVRNFWFKTQSDAENFWRKVDCRKGKYKDAVMKDGLYGDWDEIIDLRGIGDVSYEPKLLVDTVPIIRSHSRNSRAAIWGLHGGTEEDLIEKCILYDTVIIYVNVPLKLFGRAYYTQFAKKFRWIISARERFPNKRFLSAGTYIFDLQYCMGMDGCASNFIPSAGKYLTIHRPNGATGVIQVNGGEPYRVMPSEFMKDWEYLLDQYPGKLWAFYYYKMLLMTPDYIKWFYSPERMKPLQNASVTDFSYADWFFRNFLENPRILEYGLRTEENIFKNTKRNLDTNQVAGLLTKKFVYNDALFCDGCSVNYACRLYREGGACRVPSSDGKKFADKFASGNAQDILDGMGTLLQKRAHLVEKRMDKHEADETEPSKEDLSLMNGLFKDAATLAKLRDPSLTKPNVVVGINNQQALPRAITDRDYANAMREIEATGISRENITNEMIEQYIRQQDLVFESQPQLAQVAQPQQQEKPEPSVPLPPETLEEIDSIEPIEGQVVENEYSPVSDVEEVF